MDVAHTVDCLSEFTHCACCYSLGLTACCSITRQNCRATVLLHGHADPSGGGRGRRVHRHGDPEEADGGPIFEALPARCPCFRHHVVMKSLPLAAFGRCNARPMQCTGGAASQAPMLCRCMQYGLRAPARQGVLALAQTHFQSVTHTSVSTIRSSTVGDLLFKNWLTGTWVVHECIDLLDLSIYQTPTLNRYRDGD